MGSANNWLIPPAILLNNPGITREEFVKLLQEVRPNESLYNFESWLQLPWDSVGYESDYFHEGPHGLAKILGLQESKDFRSITWRKRDIFGFPLSSPELFVIPVSVDGVSKSPRYFVQIQTGNSIFQETTSKGYDFNGVNIGDVWIDEGRGRLLVDKVIYKRKLTKKEKKELKEEDILLKLPDFFAKVRGRVFHSETEMHCFAELSSLIRMFPFFDPYFMYDWSQQSETFTEPFPIDLRNQLCGLRWMQENGGYSLDMTKLPACFKTVNGLNQDGYTDLVVSAEALKAKAWKVFVYHGYEQRRVDVFLDSFPEAKRAHEKAVWDGYTSEFADRERMTVNEFLRWRLMAKCG